MANYLHVIYTSQIEAEFLYKAVPEGLVVLSRDRDLAAPLVLVAPKWQLGENRIDQDKVLVAPTVRLRDRWRGTPVKLKTRRPG
jgi:hypothetical protein